MLLTLLLFSLQQIKNLRRSLPFIFQGTVRSLPGEREIERTKRPVRILRDTGASLTVVLEGILEFSSETATGEKALIRGVELGFIQVPLHNINLNCDLIAGLITVGVIASLLYISATFQRLMNSVTGSISNCNAYIDDIVLYHFSWQDHIQWLKDVFTSLTAANLTINLAKSDFGKATITYLGHEVGQGKVKPVQAKVDILYLVAV